MIVGALLASVAAVNLFVFNVMQLSQANNSNALAIVGIVLAVCLLFFAIIGLAMPRIINPGQSYVVQFFGRYIGTMQLTGLCLIPSFCTTQKVSIKVRNFETSAIKVNDLNGNPVNIGAIVVWQVVDTAKAVFAVEDTELNSSNPRQNPRYDMWQIPTPTTLKI